MNAPRITKEEIEASIVHKEIVRHVTHSGQVLRWAIITMKNGFAVTGRPSAAVSPENDNVEIGEQVAYENAFREIWPLMGYALKDRLQQAYTAPGGLDLNSDQPLAGGGRCPDGTCDVCQ